MNKNLNENLFLNRQASRARTGSPLQKSAQETKEKVSQEKEIPTAVVAAAAADATTAPNRGDTSDAKQQWCSTNIDDNGKYFRHDNGPTSN